MAKLYFRYSAMGAGKSLDLIKVAYNYQERGMRVVLFNSSLDDRFGKDSVVSRTGIKMESHSFNGKTDFAAEARECLDEKVACMLVDEAQFLTREQVRSLLMIVDEYRIPVICYGLRTDFMGELFEGSKWLLAWADMIEELKTICWCGKKATMNARIVDGKVVHHGEQIQIGGNESYIALCGKHFREGNVGSAGILPAN